MIFVILEVEIIPTHRKKRERGRDMEREEVGKKHMVDPILL